MHPILFELGNWPVYSYGVLLAVAYLAALQLAVVRARRIGLDGARVMDLGIYLIISALVGAKLMLVLVMAMSLEVLPPSCAAALPASTRTPAHTI